MITLDVYHLLRDIWIFSYFHRQSRKTEELPALERVLKIYVSLKSFFLSEDKFPVVLQTMFEVTD